MPPKYCIDIFGRCPKKFRNRRYEHSLAVIIDERYRHIRQRFTAVGLSSKYFKGYHRQRQYGARINQDF